MRRFMALCAKELRLLSRDRHGLLVLFAVPAMFILIMSLALRDAFDPQAYARFAVTVEDRDGGALSQQLQQQLSQLPSLQLAGDAAIHLVILPGFSELLATRHEFAADYLKGEAEPLLLQLDYAPSVMPQTRAAAALTLRQALQALQSEYLLESVLDTPREQIETLRYVNDPRRLPIAERFAAADGGALQAPTSVQQNVPAWLIFALFFAVIPLATTFVIERAQGSLLRLRVLDVSALELFASKALPYYLVNLAQMAVMLAIGVWLVPALGGDRLTLGGSFVGLWLIGSATSLAAIGLALLVAVCVRTTLQATIAGGAISLLLAALGGVMVPKLVMPPAMQQLTLLSPMSWSLEGYWDLLLRGGAWTAVLDEAAALTLFGLVALALAGLLYRKME